MNRLALVSIVFAVAACSANPQRGDSNAPPPPLIVPAADVQPFFMRQNLAITARGRKQQVDVVVQYDGGVMTTVFLNPVGRPFVQMVQRGAEADISGPGVSKVPFDLRWVMQEIGLALLLTPLQQPTKAGDHQLESAAGPVRDQWSDGRLRTRVVVESPTTIDFEWANSTSCPSAISIANTARDYQIDITTTQCEEAP